MTHSPLPWHTDPRFPGYILSGPIITTPQGQARAGDVSAHIVCHLHGTRLPTGPHNQALILAAPALLAAAQKALHIASIYSGGRPDVATDLRQAIAQATLTQG